jgi:leader peptidase (prepilin peptidase)/N-methyltransferase
MAIGCRPAARKRIGHWTPTVFALSLLPNQITVRFGVTVLGMGLLSSWAAIHYGVVPTGLAALVLAGGLLTPSLMDLDHQLLPDVLVLTLLWLGLIVNSFELFTTMSHAFWGAVSGYLVLWSIRSLFKRCFDGR